MEVQIRDELRIANEHHASANILHQVPRPREAKCFRQAYFLVVHIYKHSSSYPQPGLQTNPAHIRHHGVSHNTDGGDSTSLRLHHCRPQHLFVDVDLILSRVASYPVVCLERRSRKTHRQIHSLLPTSFPQLSDRPRPVLHVRHVHSQRTL